ncbi:hypothetical protein [Serratia marcescens]|nr:hypothetical protein C2M07_14830 [Serratia marcescens]
MLKVEGEVLQCVSDSAGKTQNIDNLLKVRGMPNGEAAVYP